MNATVEAKVTASIGDSVLLHLNGTKPTHPDFTVISDHPMAAIVVYVWGTAMVNLVALDHYGFPHKMTSVAFNQPGADAPASGMYCELDCILGEVIEAESADVPPSPGTEGIVAAAPDRPMTYGEKAVGLAFNLSNETEVYKAKTEAAALIDRAHDLRTTSSSPEVARMASLAITAVQEAQMWLVKAQTWKY